jgi:hypothetical protein
MGVTINKEAVTGIRALLKYSVIRYSVAAAIVIGAVFGGLWLVKDAPFMESFKRDDKALQKISSEITEMHRQNAENHEITMKELQQVQAKMQDMEKNILVSIIFNPNVPVDKRADAFDRAKALKMNHDIKKQYREFVLKYPDAMWQIKEHQKPSLMPHTPTGAEGDE